MAVAVSNRPDTSVPSERGSLATLSWVGAAFVLGALVIIGTGVPLLWSNSVSGWLSNALGSFVDAAGLIVVELFAIGVLAMIGLTIVGGTPRKGLKAGIFTIVGWLLATAILLSMLASTTTAGQAFAAAVGISSLVGLGIFVASSSFEARMAALDEQGWFSTATYKPNQGKKVRRATLLGLMILLGCGIWTLLNHHTLDVVNKDWWLNVPFVGPTLKILPDVKFTVPLLLSALGLWLAFRLVHMPAFAEFLIATEGELNKIAWPTRKSLIQDTIVVLTTVVLLTVFLFLVDVAWGKILSNPYIGVLQIDSAKDAQPKQTDLKNQEW